MLHVNISIYVIKYFKPFIVKNLTKDAIQAELMPAVNSLFTLKNPNSCPIKGTWFAQVFDANPYYVQSWYANGHGTLL